MRIRPFALASVAALGLLAAACGDSSSDKAPIGGQSAPTTTAAPSTTTTAKAASSTTAPASAGTIVSVAASDPQFSILVEAVKAAGLVDTLNGTGPFTVFAPTNDAFAQALKDLNTTKEKLLADTATLKSILTYHVVSGKVLAADVLKLNGQQVATVGGPKLTVAVSGSTVTLNGSTKVVKTDVAASNGVIHVIDKVLVPPKA